MMTGDEPIVVVERYLRLPGLPGGRYERRELRWVEWDDLDEVYRAQPAPGPNEGWTLPVWDES